MSAKLGETLLRENLITPQQLKDALDYQRSNGGRLGSTLVKLEILSDEQITAVLSRQYGVPSVNLDLFEVDETAIKLIQQDVAKKYMVLPLSRVGPTLTLAMVDPTNVLAIDDIKFMTGLQVEPVIVSEIALAEAIERYYGMTRELELAKFLDEMSSSVSSSSEPVQQAKSNGYDNLGFTLDDQDLELLQETEEIDLENVERMAEDAPVVKLVNVILVDALRRGARIRLNRPSARTAETRALRLRRS